MIHEGYLKPNVDPSLRTEIELEDGKKVIHYLCHPAGSRKQRRYRQRHHPYFTKTRTGGRMWEITIRDHMRKRDG